MTRIQLPAIAIALGASFAGPALAADTGLTRAEVQAELAEAVRTGNVLATYTGRSVNETFPQAFANNQQAPQGLADAGSSAQDRNI